MGDEEVYDILRQISYKGYLLGEYEWNIEVRILDLDDSYCAIRATKYRRDVDTGEMGYGAGLWVMIPKDFTEQQVVAQCFRLLNSFEEHEAREGFEYKGQRVVGPHRPLPVGAHG